MVLTLRKGRTGMRKDEVWLIRFETAQSLVEVIHRNCMFLADTHWRMFDVRQFMQRRQSERMIQFDTPKLLTLMQNRCGVWLMQIRDWSASGSRVSPPPTPRERRQSQPHSNPFPLVVSHRFSCPRNESIVWGGGGDVVVGGRHYMCCFDKHQSATTT